MIPRLLVEEDSTSRSKRIVPIIFPPPLRSLGLPCPSTRNTLERITEFHQSGIASLHFHHVLNAVGGLGAENPRESEIHFRVLLRSLEVALCFTVDSQELRQPWVVHGSSRISIGATIIRVQSVTLVMGQAVLSYHSFRGWMVNRVEDMLPDICFLH